MKIIIGLKEVVDTRLSLDFGLEHPVVFREGRPLLLNPDDAGALAMALRLKEPWPDAEIALVSIGPESVEAYLRQGLSLGADTAVRLWWEDMDEPSPYLKAKLLAKTVSLIGADLVITGAGSLDTASGQVGPMLAARLDRPCVSAVTRLESGDQDGLTLIRDIGKGAREKVCCPLPAVITVKGEGKLPYASLEKLMASREKEIKVLSPADMGIPEAELKDEPARAAGLSFPRPRTKKVTTPASSLPAFDRILKLLEGGIARRRGLILSGSSAELAAKLLALLEEEGRLPPAR
jgi:electron transfer flavoprotein beta subunit